MFRSNINIPENVVFGQKPGKQAALWYDTEQDTLNVNIDGDTVLSIANQTISANVSTTTNSVTAGFVSTDTLSVDTAIVSTAPIESTAFIQTNDQIVCDRISLSYGDVTQDFGVSSTVSLTAPMAKITFTNVPEIVASGTLTFTINYSNLSSTNSFVIPTINAQTNAQSRLVNVKVDSISNGSCDICIHNTSAASFTAGTLQIMWLSINKSFF